MVKKVLLVELAGWNPGNDRTYFPIQPVKDKSRVRKKTLPHFFWVEEDVLPGCRVTNGDAAALLVDLAVLGQLPGKDQKSNKHLQELEVSLFLALL